MAKLISAVYGDALFEVAAENQAISEIYNEVTELAGIFLKNQEWVNMLYHPGISRDERRSLVEHCFKQEISEELMGFLCVVIEKGRQEELLSMFRHFICRVKEYRRIGTGFVTSAVELNSSQKKRLLQLLLDKTGYVEMEMYYKMEPELIGGLIVRVDDRVMDSSVRTRLEEMKRLVGNLQLT